MRDSNKRPSRPKLHVFQLLLSTICQSLASPRRFICQRRCLTMIGRNACQATLHEELSPLPLTRKGVKRACAGVAANRRRLRVASAKLYWCTNVDRIRLGCISHGFRTANHDHGSCRQWQIINIEAEPAASSLVDNDLKSCQHTKPGFQSQHKSTMTTRTRSQGVSRNARYRAPCQPVSQFNRALLKRKRARTNFAVLHAINYWHHFSVVQGPLATRRADRCMNGEHERHRIQLGKALPCSNASAVRNVGVLVSGPRPRRNHCLR